MKKLIIGLVALIVLVILAAVIVPLVVPVDAYEGRLIAMVKQSTGRDLKISGPVKLSLLPRLALEANDVSFANAPGAATPQMLTLKQLVVQLKLLPLLHGAVVIDRFVLVDPVIALQVDKAGRPNWVFNTAATTPSGKAAPAKPAAPAPASSSSSGGGLSLSGLSLQNVQLSNGKISYLDQRTGKLTEIDSIDMKLSLPDLDNPMSASGSAVWNREKATLTLYIDKPGSLLQGAQSSVGVKFAAPSLTLNFSGKVTGLPPTQVGGTIDLETKSLRDLARWAGSPITMSGSGLGPLSIKGDVDMAGPRISFTNAAIALDAIKAKGGVTLNTGGARPAISGQLAVDKLDVNPYLPPEKNGASTAAPAPSTAPAAGNTGAAPAPAAASPGWSDAPLDVSALKVADVDFKLQTGAILYRKYQIGQSALALHIKNGRMEADLSQMALYQGAGTGKVTVDASSAVPAVSFAFDLAHVQMEPLVLAATGQDKLTGTGTFKIAVAGRGASQRALVSALNGKGSLDVANGVIKGVNLLDLAQKAVTRVTGSASAGDTTNFGTLTATYTITNGLLRNNDLQLKSGVVPVTGAGTVNLPTRMVDYRVTPKLPGGVGVPIDVTGTWDNLSYRPDMKAILQDVAKDPGKLLDTLKSGAGGLGGGSSGGTTGGGSVGGAGQMLKGLFGR